MIFIVHSYYDGFPLLDHNLFITESSEQPMSPNVDNAKNDPSSKIMVRSTAEKNKSKQATEAAHGDAEVWGKYVFVYGLYKCVLVIIL